MIITIPKGIGGFFDGNTFACTFANLGAHALQAHKDHRDLWPPHDPTGPDAQLRSHCATIGYKELFAVWWACVQWSSDWAGLTIIVNVDNEGAKGMLNSGTCHSHNTAYMKLLRAVFWLSALRGFRLVATRITTDDNILADRLSRGVPNDPAYIAELANWRRSTRSASRCLPRDSIERFHALERLHAPTLRLHHGRGALRLAGSL